MNLQSPDLPTRCDPLAEFVGRAQAISRIKAGNDWPESADTFRCVKCGANIGTADSRPKRTFGPEMIHRRRLCKGCGHKITTVEVNAVILEALISSFQQSEAIAAALRDLAKSVEAYRE